MPGRWLGAGLTITLLVGVLGGCVGAPYPQGAHQDLVPGSTLVATPASGCTVYSVQSGPDDAPPVLFIHGTPGSWDAFAAYLQMPRLARHYRLISVDRPGFGASAGCGLRPQLNEQADLLAAVLNGLSPAIIVGHSLGGPIAVQLAADRPEHVEALVLIAGSFDPALETPRWYNRLAGGWPLRHIIPRPMRAANDEVMGLESELEKLRSRWGEVRVPVTVIQGDKDRLVYPANADFAERMLAGQSPRVQRVAGAGHFVLWNQPQRIADAILDASTQ